uniref:Uridylate-specific endoribonuclease n=1 Tax=Monopterus albus TaxID=43700 RepID=A0A3Q3K2I5_MONAL
MSQFSCLDMLVSICLFRVKLVMWLRAVTMPETRPVLRSSNMSMKTNSRVLRRMHVSSSLCPSTHYTYTVVSIFLTSTCPFCAGFMNLLDNFEMPTGVSETVTSQEVEENKLFIDAILETAVMKCAHKYLVKKGQSPSDLGQFKRQLYDIWFRLYHRERGGGEDSCGFEHVFVGETKFGKEIIGLHNWVHFYMQEKLGNVDYKGYKARANKDTPDEDDHVLNLQFSWKGLVKPVGSSFIGVSPEFEVAVFTVLFLMSTEKMTSVVVKVDEYMLELVVYRHGRFIGTSFPKLLSSNNRDL